MRRLAAVMRGIDLFNDRLGRTLSWLTLGIVFVVFATATLRYAINLGSAALYESSLWLNGILLMAGSGYCLLNDGHVRVDVFYRSASPRYCAWVNLLGVLLFLFPTIAVVAWLAWPYVATSWARMERSVDSGGLGGVFVLKSMILAYCAVVSLQGLSLAIRSLLTIGGREDLATSIRSANTDPIQDGP